MLLHWKCCQFVYSALSELGPLPAGLKPHLWLEAPAGIPGVREWLCSPWLCQLPPADVWVWVMVSLGVTGDGFSKSLWAIFSNDDWVHC